MDKEMICKNAGIVWKLISSKEKEYWSYEELNSAIGWLARENNIDMDHDIPNEKERFYVSINYYF